MFQNHGDFDQVNLRRIIETTKTRRNFNGLEFKVNYGEYAPYCVISETGKVTGTMFDTISIVAEVLNLTLIVKNPLPENVNIWAPR
jgi:hypothetical protein